MSSQPASPADPGPPSWNFSAIDLTDNSPISIVEWDPQFRLRYWNARAEEVFGWKLEEVRGRFGMNWRFVHEDDIAHVSETMRRLVTGQDRWSVCRNRNYRKDGSIAHCEWYSFTLRDSAGQLIAILCQVLDITEREQVLARLEESERRFKATFEQAAVGIAHVGMEGRWLRTNTRMCDILGYSHEELLARRFQDVTHPDDLPRDLVLVQQMIEGKLPTFVIEKRYVRKSGESIWCNLTVSLVRKPDGTPDYFICVVEDISRRHRAEQERDELLVREQKARSEAEELVRRRSAELEAARSALVQAERLATAGQLAAGVGHEINNPLSYVLANLTFAMEELERLETPTPEVDMPEVQRALLQAQLGAERIRDIVRDLRIFARSDPEAMGPVDVQAALEFSLAMVAHQVRQRARLVRHYEEVPPVLANESRLGQVFINLLLNAVQALPEGAATEHQVTVTVRPEGQGWVAIEVGYTGEGIASENLPRIFEPFFTTRPIGAGTGLGLSVCHGIVTGLGGQIQVQSEQGQGSTFRVLLPIVPRRAQNSSQAVPSPGYVASPRRVLVVDDDQEVREALARIIGPPHDIHRAETARAAQELLLDRGADYDVIFCDLMMPDITGMDLYDAIAARRPELIARMVFMTAGVFTTQATDFLARVPGRRIDKPFDPARVRSFL